MQTHTTKKRGYEKKPHHTACEITVTQTSRI